MDEIWIQRNICIKTWYKEPDFVMMHVKKKSLFEEELFIKHSMLGKPLKCFGMRVIYSYEIEEEDIICSFDGSKGRN